MVNNISNNNKAKQLLENNSSASFPAFDSKKTNEEIFTNNLPRNFRDLNTSEAKINAIASGQFSEEELSAIKKKYSNEKILIVDLRLESHIFTNGQSISWESKFDSENLSKNSKQIIDDEKNKSKQLLTLKKAIIADSLIKDEKNGWYHSISPIIVDINNSKTESQLAKELGFDYIRIPVRDHASPSKSQLNQIVKMIKNTPEDTKIYVHCAAGKGRTTTFLTIMDIVKNANNSSFEEIIKRQHKIGGSNLAKIEQETEWRRQLATERLELLKQLYETSLTKEHQSK